MHTSRAYEPGSAPHLRFPTVRLSSFLLLFCAAWIFPALAIAQAPGTPPSNAMDPNSIGEMMQAGNATLMIYLRDEYGVSPVTTPIFRIQSVTFNSANIAPPRPFEGGWVVSGLRPGDEYDIEVSIAGYKIAHKFIIVPQAGAKFTTDTFIFLRSLDEKNNPLAPSGQTLLAPQAQKEVQHALKDLGKNNLSSAHKHLLKALRMAPGDPYVNYVMGMCYLRMNKLPQARTSLEKSVSLDPKQAPALLALGMLRYRQSDFPGAIQLLSQVVRLDATAWKANWMLASSYLHQGEFEKARLAALEAIRVGEKGAAPVQLYLGEALAGLGKRQQAILAFQKFLKDNPHDPSDSRVREWIAELEKPPIPAEPTASATVAAHSPAPTPPRTAPVAPLGLFSGALPLPAVELPPRKNWAPPDIDAEHPEVVSPRACSLPRVLREAARGAENFVSDLQKFSAREETQSAEVRRERDLETPSVRTYDYLVLVDDSRPRLPQITEIRDQLSGPAHPIGSVMDVGAPVLALAFHPDFRRDFNWTCEGLGERDNQPAWVVHFEQNPNRPVSRLLAFEDPFAEKFIALKGRAWISKSDGHVIHLETDLVSPLKEIDLRRDHFSIDYRPVSFRSHKVTLWLPENVDVYLQYRGRYLHHYHHYSDFQLFWTGATQKISRPPASGNPQN